MLRYLVALAVLLLTVDLADACLRDRIAARRGGGGSAQSSYSFSSQSSSTVRGTTYSTGPCANGVCPVPGSVPTTTVPLTQPLVPKK